MDLWTLLQLLALSLAFFATLIQPQDGEIQFLKTILGGSAPQAVENLTLKLYKNNITPADTDTAATYTESTFTGYAAVALTRGAGWTLTPAKPSSATYTQQTFTSSANQAVEQAYGYFIVGATSAKLYWAERFPNGPYPISNNGDQILITPNYTLAGGG